MFQFIFSHQSSRKSIAGVLTLFAIALYGGVVFLPLNLHAEDGPILENTLPLCSDGVDNDLNDVTDLDDINCAPFKPTISIVTNIINDNGGGATSTDFHFTFTYQGAVLELSGSNEPQLFSGLPAGVFSVVQSASSSYVTTYSEGCSGSFIAGDAIICTITNNDLDSDSDTILDGNDNCPTVANTDQIDEDADGVGNACAPQPNRGGGTPPQCANGADDDGDGHADYPSDTGCESSIDTDESGGFYPIPTPTEMSSTSTASTTGTVLGASTDEPALPLGCTPYVGSYLKAGRTNDPEEVKKLQTFLNNEMTADIPVTGEFGSQTKNWVKKFQVKYYDQIIKPWIVAGWGGKSIENGTGYVYKTTKRWINLMKCQTLDIPIPSDLKPDDGTSSS